MRLKDRVVVITGAGSGIGQEIAYHVAREGAKVVLINRTKSKAQTTLDKLKENGGEGIVFEADVSKMDQMKNAMDKAVEEYGKIDVMCNIAGIFDGQNDVVSTDEATWDKVVDIDLKGTFIGSKLAVEKMRESGGGVIINISSVAGIRGNLASPAYTASKHGVIGLTGDIASKNSKDGVRAIAICPGMIQTSMTSDMLDDPNEMTQGIIDAIPLGRVGKPDEIAKLVVFLASDDASYITGTHIVIDGGMTI